MPGIPRSELEKLPYYDGQDSHGRVVQLRSYYDAQEDDWHLYLPVRQNELGRIAGGEVVHGTYFAEKPVDSSEDAPFPLGTLVARYASWKDVAVVTAKMENDLLQLASLFGKLDLIVKSTSLTDTEKSALLESEIEHLVALSRSFYDLLQKFSKRLASKVVDPADPESKVFQELPDSFARIALHGDQPRSAEEIAEAYGLHDKLANFYAAEAETFAAIRGIRDGLLHHGKQPPTRFMLDEGPAIDVSSKPWSELPVWNETELIRGRLGSVRALIAEFTRRCLTGTTRYGRAFTAEIAVPAALISEVTLFLRGPFTDHLNVLDEIIADPWE